METEPMQEQNDVENQNIMSKDELERIKQYFRNNQSVVKGVVVGMIAGIIGAIFWAVITITTGYQMGWMMVGIGFMVGQSVQKMGKGIDRSFGIMGAVISLFSCVIGNILTICATIANQGGLSILEILPVLNLNMISSLLADTFEPIDILFYTLAIIVGYKLSIYQPNPDEYGFNAMK